MEAYILEYVLGNHCEIVFDNEKLIQLLIYVLNSAPGMSSEWNEFEEALYLHDLEGIHYENTYYASRSLSV